MNTLERLRKGMLLSKDTKDNVNGKNDDKGNSENKNENLENNSVKVDKNNNDNDKSNQNEIETNKETEELTDKTEDKSEEQKDKKDLPERKISFNLNKSLLPDINIENSINSFFKFIPFNIPQKNDEKDETKKEDEIENQPEVIILDNTDESLKLYQQKMTDLWEENNFLKNQIKEYVSKVAWLEEHFTIRQENANIQHLQELEHIRKTNEKEAKEYNDR
eukprot:jgi/Orpsp1_1/1179759/evm.model.c7180000070672.1